MRAGLEIVFATRDQIHDFSVLRNDNCFLAVLVFDLQSSSTFCTCCATAPLVIVLFGIRSHG